MYQWRNFQFFEEKATGANVAQELKEKVECSTSGRGQIAVATEDASVHVIDRGLKLSYSFQAHSTSVLYIQQLKQRNMLVSVGEDDTSTPRVTAVNLKMWDLDKMQPEGSSTTGPACVRTLKVFAPKFPEAKITSFLVFEEAPPILMVCIGLETGYIYCIRGDVARERVSRLRLSVDPAVDNQPACPVTGLGFRVDGAILQLFAASTRSVNLFDMHQQPPQKHELDMLGGEGLNMTMSDNQELVVGRPEAVYFYEADGRGPCWAFDGEKRYMGWFRGYLLVVTATPKKASKNVFNIYDLKNKLIAYSVPIGDVAHVLCEWGSIIVLTKDQKVLCIVEKDMGSKLAMLFKKNLYTVAINLVQSQHADAASTAEVMRKYGDHLYEKQNYGEAMQQYIRTIGQLEPSYVIQKFLDAQQIHNLTNYLEKLHEKGLATADHTTLLLNCYTKLKDVAKLDEFIKGDESREGEHRFDVETAVRVCRAAGYYQHALYVAKRAGEHESYLKILLEDLGRYEEALQYISSLPLYEEAVTLKQYGKTLVGHKPAETTAALMKLCTGTSGGGKENGPPLNGETSNLLPSPIDFVHVFIDQPKWLMKFLEMYIETVKDSLAHLEIHNTLLELYLSEDLRTPVLTEVVSDTIPVKRTLKETESLKEYDPNIKESDPFAVWGVKSKSSKNIVLNGTPKVRPKEKTIPIVVVPPVEKETPVQRAERLKKALALLKNGWGPHEQQPRYDVDLALVLSQMHNFRDGLLFLYEKMKLYKEVMNVYMKDGDYQGLISCCKRLGDASRGGDSSIWSDVLTYFGERGEDCSKEVKEVLVYIERDNLLPPLIVLQKLAKNATLTLSVVKDYIARQIQQETRYIDEDRRAIEKYQEETATMRAEVHELKTNARVFQLSKCTACTSALDLPAVHFLCMHSFHQRCLGDNEKECPICAPTYRQVLDLRRNLEQNAGDHDTFFQLVRNSEDGFSVIADYFGRGIFSKPEKPSSPVNGLARTSTNSSFA
ncbi:hypothetical protein R1flu_006904 [Riccia fluitans]|uniref:Vacuolar protein sorting-associated protein 11 homolog n=1 Tax=Riccia fluitans TaxID=41844 RepID=A0ABD1YY69_9MARC